MDDIDDWLLALEGAAETIETVYEPAHRRQEPIRVPRIPYSSITAAEFEERYSSTNTPIILGDAFEPEGPVPRQFDLAYFKQHHRDALVPLDLGTPMERIVKLGDYMEFADPGMSKGYCRSLHTFEWFPDINAELRFPDKLVNPTNYLTEQGAQGFGYPPAWARWFELFISNRECVGFPFLHKDMCATHAMSMQVQGIKRFILFPPSDCKYLYAFGETGTRSAVPHPDICAFKVDPQHFPLYQHARLHLADLRAGDVFFCPADWWHTTVVVSAEPSVTFGGNYVDNTNRDEFMGRWREYVTAQNLVSAGIARIEHGGKRRSMSASLRSSSSTSTVSSPAPSQAHSPRNDELRNE